MRFFVQFVLFVCAVAAAAYFGYPKVKAILVERFVVDNQDVKPEATPATKAAGKAKTAPARVGEPRKADVKQLEPPRPAVEEPLPEIEKTVLALYPMPDFAPLAVLVDNWNYIPARAFPRVLTIKSPVDFALEKDGAVIGKRTLPAGSSVAATALAGSVLTISPEGSENLFAAIEMEETNLKESIAEGYEIFKERTEKRILDLREAERKRIARLSEEERMRPAGWTDGSAPVFDAMKASLRNGDLEDWLLEDARRWRWTGKETINGTTYEAGLVVTEVETIFGVFSKEIKALVRNGAVVKWVDPVSGHEY